MTSNSSSPIKSTVTVFLDVSGRVERGGGKTSILLPAALKALAAGTENQPFCTEMLHWDDVRRAMMAPKPSPMGITSAPPVPNFVTMRSLFDVPTFFASSSSIDDRSAIIESASVAVQEHLKSKPNQTFCSEMLHFDLYREQLAAPAGEGKKDFTRMVDLFMPTPPLRVDILRVSSKLDLYEFWTFTQVLRFLRPDLEKQTICTEMLHYDDLVNNQGKTTASRRPSMLSIFNPLM